MSSSAAPLFFVRASVSRVFFPTRSTRLFATRIATTSPSAFASSHRLFSNESTPSPLPLPPLSPPPFALQHFSPSTMNAPGGFYSHAVVGGGLVFISGQLPITSTGEKLNKHSFAQQAQQCLANVEAALVAAHSSKALLTQVRVYVTDIEDWPTFNQLYKQWLLTPTTSATSEVMIRPPSRCVVPVPVLHYGFAIEIEAVGISGSEMQKEKRMASKNSTPTTPALPAQHTALLLIDVQEGFDHPRWGQRNNEGTCEENIDRLLHFFREAAMPVIHVQHCSVEADSPLLAGSDGCRFKAFAMPLAGERVFQKNVNSAFIGTELENFLRTSAISTLVIVGLTTDHCVSTTTRMAGNLGFTTYLVSDATATFDRRSHGTYGQEGKKVFSADTIHAIHLASLHNEFATVVETTVLLDKRCWS